MLCENLIYEENQESSDEENLNDHKIDDDEEEADVDLNDDFDEMLCAH